MELLLCNLYNEFRPARFALRHRAFAATEIRARAAALIRRFLFKRDCFWGDPLATAPASPSKLWNLCSRVSIRLRRVNARRSCFTDRPSIMVCFISRLGHFAMENQADFLIWVSIAPRFLSQFTYLANKV